MPLIEIWACGRCGVVLMAGQAIGIDSPSLPCIPFGWEARPVNPERRPDYCLCPGCLRPERREQIYGAPFAGWVVRVMEHVVATGSAATHYVVEGDEPDAERVAVRRERDGLLYRLGSEVGRVD